MPVAWRIVKKKHQQNALTGEGARRFGGRWNMPGQAVIYCAETVSGALLEILIHTSRKLLSHYLVYRLEFPDGITSEVTIAELPNRWRNSPAPPALAEIGSRWCREQRSAVLRVPNAIVPLEANFLVNPDHEDFALVQTDGPIDFTVDDRLL